MESGLNGKTRHTKHVIIHCMENPDPKEFDWVIRSVGGNFSGSSSGCRTPGYDVHLCAVGNFDRNIPDPGLVAYLVGAARGLQTAHDIPDGAVLGCNELGVSIHPGCPGRHWNMNDFREKMREWL